jgi:hypothetical protein
MTEILQLAAPLENPLPLLSFQQVLPPISHGLNFAHSTTRQNFVSSSTIYIGKIDQKAHFLRLQHCRRRRTVSVTDRRVPNGRRRK